HSWAQGRSTHVFWSIGMPHGTGQLVRFGVRLELHLGSPAHRGAEAFEMVVDAEAAHPRDRSRGEARGHGGAGASLKVHEPHNTRGALPAASHAWRQSAIAT